MYLTACRAPKLDELHRPCATTRYENNEKETSMKKYLILAVISLSACETPAEISAREQLDAACLAGDLQACAAVQQRVAAENQALATTAAGF
jgi:hypothetical protein